MRTALGIYYKINGSYTPVTSNLLPHDTSYSCLLETLIKGPEDTQQKFIERSEITKQLHQEFSNYNTTYNRIQHK